MAAAQALPLTKVTMISASWWVGGMHEARAGCGGPRDCMTLTHLLVLPDSGVAADVHTLPRWCSVLRRFAGDRLIADRPLIIVAAAFRRRWAMDPRLGTDSCPWSLDPGAVGSILSLTRLSQPPQLRSETEPAAHADRRCTHDWAECTNFPLVHTVGERGLARASTQ